MPSCKMRDRSSAYSSIPWLCLHAHTRADVARYGHEEWLCAAAEQAEDRDARALANLGVSVMHCAICRPLFHVVYKKLRV